MEKKLLTILFMITASMCGFAQSQDGLDLEVRSTCTQRWNLNVRGGLSIGGTLPMGFPEELRSVNSYSPKFNYCLGVNVERRINDRWGLQGGLFLDKRGFRSDVTMRQFPVILQQPEEPDMIKGPFSGNVVLNATQVGINIPIQVTYWACPSVKLALGPYIFLVTDKKFEGYAYGNKVYDEDGNWTGDFDAYIRRGEVRGDKIQVGDIYKEDDGTLVDKRGTFGGEMFNNFMRQFQCGIDFTCDYYFAHHWGVFADLTYGLNSAFNNSEGNPVTMGLYPLYFTLGITYKLGK